jgi:uncharacterized protein YaiI (UPF0178 family)
LIEIFVDGDACPVKDEVYVVATRHGVPVAVVANSRMRVPDDPGVELVVVGQGADAADDWIVDHLRTGDVVVTADIPLAARVLEAGGHAVGPNGRAFTEDAIGGLVATRNLKSDLRESGVGSGGPPPLSDRDRSRFLSRLDEVVRKALRAAADAGPTDPAR